MSENKFIISSPQVFCFVLFYLLSGMMLFCNGSLFAAVFTSLFSLCLCIIAEGICKRKSSARKLYELAFGSFSHTLRFLAAFFSALPFAKTLSAFSESIASFHVDESKFAPLLVIFCIFAVTGSFYRAARFSELCVFALAGTLLLALFGGGGGASLAFGKKALFSAFDAIGAPAAFFTLYLRCVTPESEKMSDFARNSAFHPSPLAAGACAAVAAPFLYAYFCFTGNNILFALLSWFLMLARLLLFSVTMADIFAYPEEKEGAKCALLAASFCAFHIIFASLFPNFFEKIQFFAAVTLPCILFLFTSFSAKRKLPQEL